MHEELLSRGENKKEEPSSGADKAVAWQRALTMAELAKVARGLFGKLELYGLQKMFDWVWH